MAASIIAGVAAGVIGFIPLFVALRLGRRSTSTAALTTGLYGLAGSCVSLIVVAACMVACAVIDRSSVLFFGIAEMVALVAATTAYVVYKNVLAKRKR